MDFQYPCPGPITSPYGWRIVRGQRNFHNGFDQGWLTADPEGSKRLYAPAGGVIDVGTNTSTGNYVGVTVQPGWRLRLCHLASIAVTAGQQVKRGDLLGVMGETGDAIGVHLHLELWINGTRVDPQPYFTIPYGPITPIEQAEEEPMSASYLYAAPGSGKPARYAIVGLDVPGGSYVTTSVPEAEALGFVYGQQSGDRVGAPIKQITQPQLDAAVTLYARLRANKVGEERSTGTSTDPAVIAKAVNDDAARRLAS